MVSKLRSDGTPRAPETSSTEEPIRTALSPVDTAHLSTLYFWTVPSNLTVSLHESTYQAAASSLRLYTRLHGGPWLWAYGS